MTRTLLIATEVGPGALIPRMLIGLGFRIGEEGTSAAFERGVIDLSVAVAKCTLHQRRHSEKEELSIRTFSSSSSLYFVIS